MHPERSRIEAALRDGTPATHIARDFNLSRQAVSRHKHKLAARPAGQGDDERAEMRRKIQSLYNSVVSLMKVAHEQNHAGKFLASVAEARRCLNLLSKIIGVLNEPAAAPVNVAVQVDITELRAVMVGALGPYPDAAAAVAQALLDYDARAAEGEA